MGTGGHDQRVRIVELELDAPLVRGGKHFDQFIAGKPGEIIEGLDAVLSKRDQHAWGQTPDRGEVVLNNQLAETGLVLAIAALQRAARALLKLAGDLDIEAFDFR